MSEIIFDETENRATVIIDGAAAIQNTQEIKKLFLDSLAASANIAVNHQNAEEFDLTYLQLIASLFKSAVDSGKKIRFDGSNPESFTALIKGSGFHFLETNGNAGSKTDMEEN